MSPYLSRRNRFMTCLLGLAVVVSISNTSAAWVNATGSLSGVPSECGELQSIWAVPNVNKVIAGVSANGLWETANGGTTWSKMGGTSGDSITLRLTQMIFDPVSPNTWWVCGIYNSPDVFKTTDAGTTWKHLGMTPSHDGMSVDFSDPQRKLLLAGTHENGSTLWKSTDGGSTWNDIGSSIPAGGWASYPYIISTSVWLLAKPSNAGIYRTTDGGGTWSQVCTTAPYCAITKTSTGELYCAGNGKVLKGSSDGATWTTLSANCYAASPIEIPGGKIAALNANGISISADQGKTWVTGAHPIPTAILSGPTTLFSGLAYNSVAGAFYTFTWHCGNTTVLSDDIWRYDTLISATTGTIAPHPGVSSFVQGRSGVQAAYDIRGREIDHRVTGIGALRNKLQWRIIK
jgi:photosystem II stability/assembly factor-like uncharacterized protein